MSSSKAFLRHYVLERDCFDEFEMEENEANASKKASMKRCLNLFDLFLMGVAAIVGAGIFVVTGIQAKNNAGPGIIISYALAGFAAIVTAICYAEFATELTITGGTFVYLTKLWGRAFGWFIAINVLLEYMLASSTVAIGWASYMASLCGQPGNFFQISVGSSGFHLNPMAAGLVILLSVLLIFGVKETFWLNSATVVISIVTILITVGAGGSKVDSANYTKGGFLPYGFSGVFTATSSVFFAYIGFDQITQSAEEAAKPKRDIPLAIISSTLFATCLYMAMATVIVGMVYYPEISSSVPFADAFKAVGMNWASYVVSVGAVAGTFNTVLVSVFSLQRIVVVLARTDLIPSVLGKIHPKTKTPVVAAVFCGLLCAVLSFCVPLEVLADAVSMGTLTAFSFVCLGVSYRARYQPGCATPIWKALLPSVVSYGGAVGAGFSYGISKGAAWPVTAAFVGLWFVGTGLFYIAPVVYTPTGFRVPFNPWISSFGVLCSVFLIGTLNEATWFVWLYAQAAGLIVYVTYGYVKYVKWTKAQLPSAADASVMVKE